ncbi:hypothetical protein NDU88_010596 [Pleurodeles waltl]|uniref:Uncharacterized protein n=1 Tax=Pleurodeles waltl TaxID=8319 RepID=A0AAV7PW58_PLEWA|nr:hypothetical protein NDU88_010596 [Pleurodeles waltl]
MDRLRRGKSRREQNRQAPKAGTATHAGRTPGPTAAHTSAGKTPPMDQLRQVKSRREQEPSSTEGRNNKRGPHARSRRRTQVIFIVMPPKQVKRKLDVEAVMGRLDAMDQVLALMQPALMSLAQNKAEGNQLGGETPVVEVDSAADQVGRPRRAGVPPKSAFPPVPKRAKKVTPNPGGKSQPKRGHLLRGYGTSTWDRQTHNQKSPSLEQCQAQPWRVPIRSASGNLEGTWLAA